MAIRIRVFKARFFEQAPSLITGRANLGPLRLPNCPRPSYLPVNGSLYSFRLRRSDSWSSSSWSRMYLPMSARSLAYIALRRYFRVNTTWYLQSHFVCERLETSSFLRGIIVKTSGHQGQLDVVIACLRRSLRSKASAYSSLARIAGGFRLSLAVHIKKPRF